MLEALRLTNVGPAHEMSLELKPRVNFLAGDNGLGKSFLLDVAWWVMTRTWARRPVVPHLPPARAELGYRYSKASSGSHEAVSHFDRDTETWKLGPGRPPIPGLVLYAQVDGGFSVWDPARNYRKSERQEHPPSYCFTAPQVWDGNELCEGLVRDWASWQREGGAAFRDLCSVLRALSPTPEEQLTPGELRKLSLDDPKRYPTLKMPYGQEVAVVHASAGMQRIIALSYILVWTWQEHLASCQLRGQPPAREVIFLIDEIEAHLHPQWQRRIVPALLDVMSSLTGAQSTPVQLIAATHSPLVLASLEPRFDPEKDAVFHLEMRGDQVHLHEQAWARQGDVVSWLVSDTFGLRQGRSLEAERAIDAANSWMRGERERLPAGLATHHEIDTELRRVLADHDAFWPRWVTNGGR